MIISFFISAESYTQNGYVRFYNGLIIQWANNNAPSLSITSNASTSYIFNFPIIFTNYALSASAVSDSWSINTRLYVNDISIDHITLVYASNINIQNYTGTVKLIILGY